MTDPLYHVGRAAGRLWGRLRVPLALAALALVAFLAHDGMGRFWNYLESWRP